MATPAIPHDQRQPIEIIPPAETDVATKLIAFLDAALALPGYVSLTVFAAEVPEAEHVFRLWASAKQLPLEETNHRYEPNPPRNCAYSIRSIEIRLGSNPEEHKGHVKLQWGAVYSDEIAAPSNVIPLPTPTASQPDAVTEPAQPRDLDDAAERFSLLELD